MVISATIYLPQKAGECGPIVVTGGLSDDLQTCNVNSKKYSPVIGC